MYLPDFILTLAIVFAYIFYTYHPTYGFNLVDMLENALFVLAVGYMCFSYITVVNG